MVAVFGKNLLVLLLLRIVQDRFYSGRTVLLEGFRFGAASLARKAAVCAQILHLLLAICEDGSELLDLVAAQSELLAKMRGLFRRVPFRGMIYGLPLT